jgi:hypothetical protein
MDSVEDDYQDRMTTSPYLFHTMEVKSEKVLIQTYFIFLHHKMSRKTFF